MRRTLASFLLSAALCTMSETAPAEGSATVGGPPAPSDVQWALHVLYLPGSQDLRSTLNAQEGAIAVRAPWQCSYKRTTLDQYDLVKIKCVEEGGAVVGTGAMCRREFGQSDLAQLSIGVDGVATYETIDLSCSVPRERGHGEQSYEQRK